MSTPGVGLPIAPPASSAMVARSPGVSRDEWLRVARWARWLSWASLAYMAVEGAVALAAGVVAGSIALVGFGIDSAIEGLASLIVVWRFTGTRLHSDRAERRAQRLVAITFFLLAPYIAVEAIRDLAGGVHPEASPVGIALAISSIVLMPVLGLAKQRIGQRLGSTATQGEGAQNLLCAYMAGALLVGLACNALFGLWWLDPVAALAIAGLAVREGVEAWRGQSCCIPATSETNDATCAHDCCKPPVATDVSPIAECRLDLPSLRTQADRYRKLGATATQVQRSGGALDVTFDAQLDERLLKETIAVERECCPFYKLDYHPSQRRLSITVQQPEQQPALDALQFALTGHDTARDEPRGHGSRQIQTQTPI